MFRLLFFTDAAHMTKYILTTKITKDTKVSDIYVENFLRLCG